MNNTAICGQEFVKMHDNVLLGLHHPTLWRVPIAAAIGAFRADHVNWVHATLTDLIAQPSTFTTAKITMWILPLLGYVGVVLGFAFLTLAIGTY